MYKQSPSRNHRSKGFKVKHVLQICLLLAVCFWLMYQVKRSHDKREEFDTKDEKSVGKVQTDPEILRFGRKDLPRITETATDVEEHSLDEEEKEAEEEENKHEEDEPEIEDNRIQDKEDEDMGREGVEGDDEIDENELAKAEAEHEDEIDKSETEVKKTEMESAHEEEQVDDDKEREENEGRSVDNHTENEEIDDARNEDHFETEEHEDAAKEDHSEAEEDEDGSKADHNESDVKIEERDHDGDSTNTHEAREEQYKADDASSEVTHDIQTFIPETRNVTNGHANEIWSKVNFGQENETITSKKDDTGLQTREDKVINNGTLTNATITELKEPEINSTKSDDSSLQNSTLSQNATIEGATAIENPTLLGNISEHINKSDLAVDDENQSLAAAGSNKTENVNSNAGESLISSDTSASFHNINDTNTMSTEGKKLENSGTDGSDGSSTDHSSNEGVNFLQNDPIDGSDTTLTQEEKDSRMDLDTLLGITTEVQNTDDTMAE